MFSGLRLVYMPEFLRERSSYSWFLETDRLMLSGDNEDIETVLSDFTKVNNVEILRISHKYTKIGKFTHNVYISTKVSFTNEIESFNKVQICTKLSVHYTSVMKI